MLSPTALLEDAQDYLDERLTALAELARRAGLREVWWQDSENRPLELSFDPATLDLFRRVAGLEQPGLGPVAPLGPARILAEPALRQRWSGFRSEQNTALTALLYRRLKALIPGLRWWVRGGYQGPDAVTEWGLDWRLRAPHLDGIFAGPGPDGAEAVDAALATWQAVRHVAAVPVSGAVGSIGLPGAARWHDSALTGARRVLGAAAGAVGLDNGDSFLTMDGGHLTGLAAAAGFVAAHEPLLLTGQRQLYDTNHDGLVDVVVVRHTSSVLTVAANQTAWPVTVLPRCGQAGDLPAELTLAPGTWQTWRTDTAPLVPDGHR